MAEETKPDAGGEAPAAAPAEKPKSNLMLVIIIGVVITVATPVITFFVVKATVPPPVSMEEKPSLEATSSYDLKEMYVNIAETKGTRILKVQPVLIVSDAKLAAKLEGIDPLLKDRVIMAISTKTIDELEGANGKESLKREMISALNAAIKDKMAGAIMDVYFTQFLIQ